MSQIKLSAFNKHYLTKWIYPGPFKGSIIIFFWLLLPSPIECADVYEVEPFIIFAIEVIGNRKTDHEFIIREARLSVGKLVTAKDLAAAKENLESLGLFNRVQILSAIDNGRGVVRIVVTESFYLYLYPVIKYDDEPRQVVYGVIVGHWNFRGHGEILRGGAWGGENERVATLSATDKWFRIRDRYALGLSVQYSKFEVDEDSVRVRREVQRAEFEIRRRLHQRLSWLGLTLNWEVQQASAPHWIRSPTKKDRIFGVSLVLTDDERDYIYYPRDGYLLQIINTSEWVTDLAGAANIQTVDLRLYHPVAGITIASRLWSRGLQGEVGRYHQLAVPSSVLRVGGATDLIGSMTAALNLEIRFNILPINYITFKIHKLVNPYLLDLKYSLEGVIFYDKATIQFTDGGDVRRQGFTGFGGGFQMQLPYIQTAHILMGWIPGGKIDDFTLRAGLGVTF